MLEATSVNIYNYNKQCHANCQPHGHIQWLKQNYTVCTLQPFQKLVHYASPPPTQT